MANKHIKNCSLVIREMQIIKTTRDWWGEHRFSPETREVQISRTQNLVLLFGVEGKKKCLSYFSDEISAEKKKWAQDSRAGAFIVLNVQYTALNH